jgi:hypothetical protein
MGVFFLFAIAIRKPGESDEKDRDRFRNNPLVHANHQCPTPSFFQQRRPSESGGYCGIQGGCPMKCDRCKENHLPVVTGLTMRSWGLHHRAA